MASNYPGALDTFSTAHADGTGEVIQAATINDIADGVKKIEAELGINPRGTSATVKDRLDTIANVELGYAEITSNFAPVMTGSIPQDITGLDALSVTIGSRPVVVEFFCPVITHSVAGSVVQVQLWDATANVRLNQASGTVASGGQFYFAKARVAPAAGARIYKAVLFTFTGGTVTVFAASIVPTSLQVIQV